MLGYLGRTEGTMQEQSPMMLRMDHTFDTRAGLV